MLKTITMRLRTLLFFLLGCLAACEPTPETGEASTPSQQLAQVVADYFEQSLSINPLLATRIGDDRYDDQFPNWISPEVRTRFKQMQVDALERIDAIDTDSLSGQDLLTWQVFRQQRQKDLEGTRFPGWLVPVNQFYSLANTFAQMGSGEGFHPFNTVKNYEDFLKRAQGFATWVDQAITNMREGVEVDVVNPIILMERTLPQLQAHIVADTTESLFYGPVTNMPESFNAEDRQRLTNEFENSIEQVIVPAYRRLHAFILDEYLPHCRDTVGLNALPDGDAWYAFLVRMRTTTNLEPEVIHQTGLSEVARIHEEMRDVMTQVNFDGDLDDFFEFMNTQPEFFFDKKDDLINGYYTIRKTVDANVASLFDRLPVADYEIRPVEPFREQSAAGGSYQRAAPDASRPGIFYANTFDLSSRPKWAMEALFLHEAAPGHHFQISLQQEVESLPLFRRFGGHTAYIEGWALYAESLGKELGVYTNPYNEFGALNAELWRAIRLVVDTGLHAKGWSKQDVLDYMYANSAVTESRAVPEAERYIAAPAQALAYKVGQLKIRELRDRSEAQLGEDFDVKRFHRAILVDGSLPLDVLETKMDHWMTSQ